VVSPHTTAGRSAASRAARRSGLIIVVTAISSPVRRGFSASLSGVRRRGESSGVR
jgi:hypothetical protein